MSQSEYPSNEFINKLIQLFRIKQDDGVLKIFDKEIIGIEQVKELFEEIESSLSVKEFTIFYNNDENIVAEIAVANDLIRRRWEADGNIVSIDDENNVKYEISELTDYYLIWIYKKLFEKYPIIDRVTVKDRVLFVLRDRAHRLRRNSRDESNEVSLLDVMRKSISSWSLKVRKEKQSSLDLEEALNSYSYTYMCNMNAPIKVYSVEEIIGVLNRKDRERNLDFEPPKRKYNKNLMDYYNLAVASDDPFISFISYYHIIEYFYDEVFREQQINSLRASITAPRFSYKSDEQLFKIIEKITKDSKLVKENGSGNEQQSLNYVLNKFINDLDEFKDRLTEDELNFYQNHQVSFSRANVIPWNDRENVIKKISSRIYKTRNSLIHSKSSKKDVTYHPYLHKSELSNEISLIKAIAECIIENDSKYLI